MDGMTSDYGHERCVQSVNQFFVNPCGIEAQSHEFIPGVAVNQDASFEIPATIFLDSVIPLFDASYADVESFGVDIPMRYSRFYARLQCGAKVRLRNPRVFVGWSRQGDKESYLFFDNGLHIEVRVDPEHPRGRTAPANISAVIPQSTSGVESQSQVRDMSSARKFIAVDGSQILLFDYA